MAQQFLQEASNTFIKGLITEAGELTFPKDASVDELNCDLERDGSRRRRLGVEEEAGFSLSSETISDSTVVSTNSWTNVGGEAGVEFSVVQLGSDIIFYQKSSGAWSGNRVNTTKTSGSEYTLDLTPYARSGGSGASSARVDCTSINGALVIASPEIETLLVERNSTTGAFTVTQIDFKVRDFEWQGDTSTYYKKSSSNPPGVDRRYDTLNTGWVGTTGGAALTTYASAESAYPPLTLPWYSGKDSSDDFSVSEWKKIFSGNTLIVNGHFILDLFDKNRNSASGLSGVSSSTESARFGTVAAYSGRVFYAGLENSSANNGSKIYFSRLLIDDFDEVGDCYQVNDPTSEVLPDLLDTDGGVIYIPEAYNIKKLHVFGPTLYIFAENGVWAAGGVDDVFRATEYSVSKITEAGLGYKDSFISANGRPYWWSYLGIFTVAVENNSVVAQNISIGTIQTFWEAATSSAKSKVVSVYDGVNNRILWLYPNTGESVETKFNNVLLFDETIGAFFPWKIVDESSNTSAVIGADFYNGAGSSNIEVAVTDSSGTTVTDSSGDAVVVTRSGRDFSSSAVKLLIRDGATNKVTFGGFSSTSFYDWGSMNYSSYAEAAYNFMGDLTTFKNAPYIMTYCKTTETGWELVGSSYTPIRESSCYISSHWDFKTSSSSVPQQIYRPKPAPVVNTSNLSLYDYPKTVVTARIKTRGRGRNMKLRFESEEGKDFHLLGYEVIGAKNQRF